MTGRSYNLGILMVDASIPNKPSPSCYKFKCLIKILIGSIAESAVWDQ